MQPLSFACDAVENLTSARRLDGAFGYGNDLVRAALKETATDSALLTGSKGSGSLMTKATRRRIFTRVAKGDAHTANRIDSNALALTKLGKQLLHSSLLSRQLLFIRTIERRAPTARFHDRTGRLGVHGLTRRRNPIFMRALGTSLRRFIPASTRVRTLGLSSALGRFAFCSFRRLGFRRRFLLLRPLSRLDQSTTSLTLRTRFCHELTPLIYKLKSESIVPCQASGRYASVHFVSVISPTMFAPRPCRANPPLYFIKVECMILDVTRLTLLN